MAGIGFELKKLFKKTGVFHSVRAFSCAAVITTGPMLLGILLILGLMGLCALYQIATAERELLICMINYTLLASIMISSCLSMVVTRFLSDMLYEERYDEALPSFWGSAILMMVIGGIPWLVFVIFSGAAFVQGFLLYVFFEELLIVWHAMSYLTAIKDYKNIFISFFAAIAVALLLGLLFLRLHFPAIESLLCAVCIGYGVKMIWDIILLYRHFPRSEQNAFHFMSYMDKYKTLPWIGLFTNIGLFSHLIIMWFSDIGVPLKGVFYGAPYYDVPALMAFLTMLMTTINFVVSVEVNFYPKYRNYSSLYRDNGTAKDIAQAESEMLKVLKAEVFYTSLKQLLFTALCIALGGYLLELLPLGFNEVMKGYFRTLCVSYGVYAIGNMLMLLLLYFVDYTGAFWATAVFSGSSILFSVISLWFPSVYYGFGFLSAAMIFVIFTVIRLNYYTKRLPYYIICVQPLIAEKIDGVFTQTANFLDKHLGEEKNQ